MMNVLLVEDEVKTAELLKELIESKPDFIVVSIQDSIESTVNYLNKNQEKIDLLFLDIQLADGQSFEIFNRIHLNIPVVFCTAYDEYLLQAFKKNGIDYILKPFDDDDIFNSLEKIKRLKSSFSKDSFNPIEKVQTLLREQKPFQKSIIAYVGEKMIPITVDSILLFHLEYEAVNIYCSNGEKYVVLKRMDEIQSLLDDRQFFRINRQMIINRNAVKEIVPYFNRKVIVKTTFSMSEKVIVSRLKVTPFLNWLEKPI
jgi:DNA-binding LytR/AlgR family response regulator